MSGGHFYGCSPYEVWDTYRGQFCDREIDALFEDLFDGDGVADALDMWRSGDWSEGQYREVVAEFKDKWFRRTPKNRVEFYKRELQGEADRLMAEFDGRCADGQA